MKNTIKMITIVLWIVSFSTSTEIRAQRMQQNGEVKMDDLIKKLNLTEEQTTKFIQIQEEYKSEISDLRSQGKNAGTREKIESINAKKDTEIKQILTEAQFVIYEASERKEQSSKSGRRTRG